MGFESGKEHKRLTATVIPSEGDIMHYGMPRRSGRYPWGSGENPYQHSVSFLSRIDELKKKGWKESADEIMKEFGMTTNQYRAEKGNALDELKCYQINTAKSLKERGLGWTAIGKEMGVPEATVRGWFKEKQEINRSQARNTAEFLKEKIKEKGMIDVGTGTEIELGISKEKLNQALKLLSEEGYPVYSGRIEQATNKGKHTTQKVLCPPGTEHKEIYNYDKVSTLTEYKSHDDGNTFDKIVYPKSLDSKRLKILLRDEINPIDGEPGVAKDGVIQLRRGVKDLSLGDANYSQVRILVDGNKYLKGMAVYSDNMPDGVDVIFNSNKTSYEKALKPVKTLKDGVTPDPDNPFGSLIKSQEYYIDDNGKKQLGLINKRADEGDWSDWADALPSQFLSKQSLSLAKRQLNIAKADKLAEYEEICSLTNPTVKKHLLEKFALECDASAVNLKAAALPGQKYHVIIPNNTLKENEIYAPDYPDGTKLALIRYPHGGKFEIPIVTVNNRNETGKRLIGDKSIDAVCINKSVADRLSGADFDGDTVMCIPTHNGKVKIENEKPLAKLEGFDPQMEYPERPGMKYMKDPKTGKDATQSEMGMISNLITDMTLAGAQPDELARAVRHSMVVIDAAKHKLDYKQSEIDNDIAGLKKIYQAHITKNGTIRYGGASTIISRASGQETITKRQGQPWINLKSNAGKFKKDGTPLYDPNKPEGSLLYKDADDAIWYKKVTKKDGTVVEYPHTRHQKSTKMMERDDAFDLVSEYKYPMEIVYAEYANDMKALANKARIELSNTGKIAYDKNAREVYKNEVNSLNEKLKNAELNAPKEREAQRRARVVINTKKEQYDNLKPSEIRKISQQAISTARASVGSIKRRDRNIEITDREWEAIQSGAVSENILTRILKNSDTAKLRERATPKNNGNTLSEAKINRIKAMSASCTIAQIAESLGVSTSTVSKYLKGEM